MEDVGGRGGDGEVIISRRDIIPFRAAARRTTFRRVTEAEGWSVFASCLITCGESEEVGE